MVSAVEINQRSVGCDRRTMNLIESRWRSVDSGESGVYSVNCELPFIESVTRE